MMTCYNLFGEPEDDDELQNVNIPEFEGSQGVVALDIPTKPLAHWPFRWQTAERPKVSPEVILNGLVEESSLLNQVL